MHVSSWRPFAVVRLVIAFDGTPGFRVSSVAWHEETVPRLQFVAKYSGSRKKFDYSKCCFGIVLRQVCGHLRQNWGNQIKSLEFSSSTNFHGFFCYSLALETCVLFHPGNSALRKRVEWHYKYAAVINKLFDSQIKYKVGWDIRQVRSFRMGWRLWQGISSGDSHRVGNLRNRQMYLLQRTVSFCIDPLSLKFGEKMRKKGEMCI